jgi:hypothetical protein
MSNWCRIPFIAVLGFASVVLTAILQAEVPNQSLEALKKNSTHIVTGQVEKVTEISTKSANIDDIKGVCEITVTTCEKGEGIAIGKVIKARYERRPWIGRSPSPPRSSGHRGIPKKGDTVRIYMSKAKDGAYDAAFPNGFEQIDKEQK